MESVGLRPGPRYARPGMAVLVAALAVELVDELVGGTQSAAMPLIRHDLALSYLQIGLLGAVPLIVGSLVELPFGVISGTGRRRRRFILAGGLAFIASVLGVGLSGSFVALLIALVAFFPASGVFVSLTQSALMDAAPDRRAQHMGRWTLAGSVGAVAGPLLLAVVLAAGGTWRLAFVLIAACSATAWLAVERTSRAKRGSGAAPGRPPADAASPGPSQRASVVPLPTGTDARDPGWPGWRAAASIIRRSGALRWLLLLEVADLMLDVLTAFLALYLVATTHAAPSAAALAVAARLGAGLGGDVMVIRLLARHSSLRVLRVSGWLTIPLFPAFLLAPGLGPKLVVLAAVTVATAPWYPVLKAELYGSLPDRSGLAVSLGSAAGLAGGLGPLAIGILAQRFGLTAALAPLCVVPAVMLAVLALPRARQCRQEGRGDQAGHGGPAAGQLN